MGRRNFPDDVNRNGVFVQGLWDERLRSGESIGDSQASQRPDSGKLSIPRAREGVNGRWTGDERSQTQLIPPPTPTPFDRVCERSLQADRSGQTRLGGPRGPLTAPQSVRRGDRGLPRCRLEPRFLITGLLFPCGG